MKLIDDGPFLIMYAFVMTIGLLSAWGDTHAILYVGMLGAWGIIVYVVFAYGLPLLAERIAKKRIAAEDEEEC